MRKIMVLAAVLLSSRAVAATHQPAVVVAGQVGQMPVGDTLAISGSASVTGSFSSDGGALTTDGSGDLAATTLDATQSTWTAGSTRAGVYTASTIGVGWTTPGTYVDIRYNWGGGKDPFEIVMGGPNTSNGIEVDWVRSYNTITSPTSTGITTVIYDLDAWGYNTNNTVSLVSHIRAMVDQAPTSGSVYGDFEIWNTTTAGNAESFRIDSAQHPSTLAPGTPTLGSCGTSPSFLNNEATDAAGTIVLGSSATSGCTMTFRMSWSLVSNGQIPHCTVTARNGSGVAYGVSSTQLTITSTTLSGVDVDYTCLGGQTP